MMNEPNKTELVVKKSVCVILPTFNNATTLSGVLADVLRFTSDVIVVNDGSTDQTASILAAIPGLQTISYAKNKGKGWALRKGFALAISLGYDYAITMDADGQHFAKDLPAFWEALKQHENSLLIGARNMEQDSVPGKSSFGNRFSNFWFHLETGIKCPDTQSGYRLYPLKPIREMRLFTTKFEFEIEILVRLAWKGVPVKSIPVSVYYPPKEERVSHFRPFKDFARISLLNTVLVLISLFYIWPRNFIRALFDKKKINRLLRDELFHPRHSDPLKALSIGFGVFMGIVPIWGFQLVVAIFLAILLNLNKPLVILAANISIPPMIPLIVFASYKTGAWWMRSRDGLPFSNSFSLQSVRFHLVEYISGSIILAVFAGLTASIITLALLRLFKRKTELAS